MANKFQEDWYPEGIDPNRQTFLKRSLRNYSFDPNRNFPRADATSPSDMLIPRLYNQFTASNSNKRRQIASDLQRVVKEG